MKVGCKLSQFSLLLVKMVDRYGAHVTFQDGEHKLKKNHTSSTVIELRCFFNPLKTI